MPFGGAYRMSGFGDGFDGYLGLGRSVDFNETKIGSTASGNLKYYIIIINIDHKIHNHFRFIQA
jgi:hypothetical protein